MERRGRGRWKRGNEGFQQEKEPKTEACKRERERERDSGGRRGGTSTVGVVVYLDTDLKRTLGNLTFS